MKKISQKLRFGRKKDGLSTGNSNKDAAATENGGQRRQRDGESSQPQDGLNISHNQPDHEELGTSVQAASQALRGARGLDGEQLKEDDKLGYHGQLITSVVEKLSAFNDLVQKIADAHPYSKIAWMIISSVVTVTTYAQDADQNILDLFTKLDSTYRFIEDTKEIEKHPAYERILTNLAKQTVDCAYFIRDYAKVKNFWIRTGKNLLGKPIKARVKLYQDAFDGILTEFRNNSVLHSEIAVGRLLELNKSIGETLVLGNFPYAPGAGLYTGKKCLPGTRIEILDEMINWVNDTKDDCPRLFWLAGPAGVGKSAIAHSIALFFQSIGRLGSFFCFDRSRSTERREKVFSTIARDLADLDVQIKHELVKAIHDKTSLQNTPDLQLQWENFLFKPFQAISEAGTGPILVVIDALDESGDPISRQELLKILAKETSSLPTNIRFLVTSRPEQDIIAAFRELQPGRIRSKLMDSIPDTQTKCDIFTYFKTNLADYSEGSFFGDSQLRQLVELSQGLFQWAHLALQFLRGLGNAAGSTVTERYEDLINVQHVDSINDNLDTMYTQILSSLFNTRQSRAMTRFRSVIGSILAASESLSLNSLVALWGGNIPLSQRERDIKAVIQYMGSVLSGIDEPSAIIRPLHLSFHEYLLDKDRSKDFFIDLSQCHQDFAFGCLCTMMEELRFNICDITNSHQFNSDDEDLPARISSRISIPLSYSSRFWGLHVSSSVFDSSLARKIEEFFHQNFLHWLEVMSLLRAVHMAVRSMSSLIFWSSGGENHKSLHDFAMDGIRFVRVFSDAITVSTPHIYLSALPFCPEKSIIYQTFIHQFPNTLRIASDPIHNWPVGQRTMSLPGDARVTCICFSHGGEYLVVGLSRGILKLINSESFDVVWTKELSKQESVDGIQFFPDDNSLVFATWTGIHILDIPTGVIALYNTFPFVFESLPEVGPYKLNVTFSPDVKFIANYNQSHLTVWNLETGEQAIALSFEHDSFLRCSFLDNDNSVLVIHSIHIGVQLWDLERGAILHGPIPHPSQINSEQLAFVAVSPNGKHIIFIESFRRVIVWNFRDDSIVFFDKHVEQVTFSPDGNCLMMQSSYGRLYLHYLNGNEVYYETDRGVNDVAYSRDGRWLAVRSGNHLVIRELDGWQSTDDQLERLPAVPQILNTSSDGKYFVSMFGGKSYKVWDVQSGQPIHEIPWDTDLDLTNLVLSPAGRYLGYLVENQCVNVYDIDSGISKQISFGDQETYIECLVFSQNEQLLAVLCTAQRKIYIWDIDSSQMMEPLTIPEPTNVSPLSLMYSSLLSKFQASSNFRYFVCTQHSYGVILLDHDKTTFLELQPKNSSWIDEDFAFSLDGEYILISCLLEIFHINLITKEWQVIELGDHGLCEKTMLWHSVPIMPSSDSETLLVGINGVKFYDIWDALSGQLLQSYSTLDEYPSMCVQWFVPVYQYLFTETSDEHIRILTLKQKRDNRICFSSDDRHSLKLPPGSSARLREDGWVITQNNELLFWVPKDYHSTLHTPRLVYILGKKSIELDLSSFSHGELWTTCKS